MFLPLSPAEIKLREAPDKQRCAAVTQGGDPAGGIQRETERQRDRESVCACV